MSKEALVKFHGNSIRCAVEDGEVYVSVKSISENLGIDSWGQQAKLRSQRKKFNYRDIAVVAADGKKREVGCIPLKKLNGWLFSINAAKTNNPQLIEAYQEECFGVLYNYFHKGAALNPAAKTRTEESLAHNFYLAAAMISKRRVFPLWEVARMFEFKDENALREFLVRRDVFSELGMPDFTLVAHRYFTFDVEPGNIDGTGPRVNPIVKVTQNGLFLIRKHIRMDIEEENAMAATTENTISIDRFNEMAEEYRERFPESDTYLDDDLTMGKVLGV